MLYLRLIVIAIFIGLGSPIVFAQKIAKEQFTSNGKKRNYYLFIPATAKPATPAPLLVLFHGSNRNGLSLAEKWKNLAEQEGLVLLAPDSTNSSHWFVPVDGPQPLHELIESIRTKYPVNSRRIYLFGHSAGAIFALLMSFHESEYFAATAIHAGALNSNAMPSVELAKRKIPIHIQVGVDDPFFPLTEVRATRDALKTRGFPVQLTEIPHHNHWYYDRAPKINQEAWTFLKAHELAAEPRFEEHQFGPAGGVSSEANQQYNRGLERHRAGDLTAAIAAYTRTIELDGKFADAYNNRGVAYLALQDYAAAIADFTRSIELKPSSDASYNNRANIYSSQNKFHEAISDYTEAIKIKPSAEAYSNRGVLYERTSQRALALPDYESAIKLNPNFGRAYVLRGLIALRARQVEVAQKDFDKAFELDPSLRAEFEPIIRQVRSLQ